ncbi:MAG: hypothetical protein NW226_22405 [Microscillaceae bacterium]|nr:hypothetical protein [Microscillaceae bacterium]
MQEIAFLDKYRLVLNIKQEFEGYQTRFEGYFFNDWRHISQQGNEEFYTFFLIHKDKKYLDARLTVFVQGRQGLSPYRAPFGGIECTAGLSPEVLIFFIREVEQFLQKKSIDSLQIKAFPFAYSPESTHLLTHSLLLLNYKLTGSELSYHIPVSDQDFESQIHLSEKRRLKKLKNNGFYFHPISDPDLGEVYDFVRKARLRKGFPVSLTELQFRQLFAHFPHEFKVFVVEDSLGNQAALTVAVVVNQRILYNFYPADHIDYQEFSPTVMLNEGLYDFAQKQHFEILDLGISTVQGEPNPGLIRFKKNLGAQTTLKLSFYKNLI